MMFPEETFQVFKTGQEKVRLFSLRPLMSASAAHPAERMRIGTERHASTSVGGVSNIDGF